MLRHCKIHYSLFKSILVAIVKENFWHRLCGEFFFFFYERVPCNSLIAPGASRLSEQNGSRSSWLGLFRKATGLTTEKQVFSLNYKESCGETRPLRCSCTLGGQTFRGSDLVCFSGDGIIRGSRKPHYPEDSRAAGTASGKPRAHLAICQRPQV